MPRDSRIAAREAAAMPFPREETTPPVTNTYFAIYPARVGMGEFTGNSRDLPSLGDRDFMGYPCLRTSVMISLAVTSTRLHIALLLVALLQAACATPQREYPREKTSLGRIAAVGARFEPNYTFYATVEGRSDAAQKASDRILADC